MSFWQTLSLALFIFHFTLFPPIEGKIPLAPPNYDGPIVDSVPELFKVIDENGDAKVSLDEALGWYSKLAGRPKEELAQDKEILDNFSQMDTNGDGFLQLEEMENTWALLTDGGGEAI